MILENGSSTDAPVELQLFCNASTKAYRAVAYFLQGSDTYFVFSKARVHPLQLLTLPSLKLMGATVAAQIFNVITSSMQCKIDLVHTWCDSQTVLLAQQ